MDWYSCIWHWYAEHHDGHHHSHDHVHDPGVSSVSIVCEGNLDLEKVGSLHSFSFLCIVYDYAFMIIVKHVDFCTDMSVAYELHKYTCHE